MESFPKHGKKYKIWYDFMVINPTYISNIFVCKNTQELGRITIINTAECKKKKGSGMWLRREYFYTLFMFSLNNTEWPHI